MKQSKPYRSTIYQTYNASNISKKNAVTYDMNLNRFCYFLLTIAAIGSFFTVQPFAMWFLLINLLTLVIYGVDKFAARQAWYRVPESTLLVFGCLGGWVGAMIGQQLFRHKTQKQPFRTYFIISVIFNIIAIILIYHCISVFAA